MGADAFDGVVVLVEEEVVFVVEESFSAEDEPSAVVETVPVVETAALSTEETVATEAGEEAVEGTTSGALCEHPAEADIAIAQAHIADKIFILRFIMFTYFLLIVSICSDVRGRLTVINPEICLLR